MLVYLKQPMASTSIDGKRIYGKKYAYGSMGPTNVSIETYKRHQELLEEASFTKVWLDNKFDKNFPNIEFKISEINRVEFHVLVDLANLLGIKYSKGRKKPTSSQLLALRRSIAKILNETL